MGTVHPVVIHEGFCSDWQSTKIQSRRKLRSVALPKGKSALGTHSLPLSLCPSNPAQVIHGARCCGPEALLTAFVLICLSVRLTQNTRACILSFCSFFVLLDTSASTSFSLAFLGCISSLLTQIVILFGTNMVTRIF